MSRILLADSNGRGDDHKNEEEEEEDGDGRRNKVSELDEHADRRGGMAERRRSEEPAEQIDFDGDKDIEEDIVDEENPVGKENGHRKARESVEEDHKEEENGVGRREKASMLEDASDRRGGSAKRQRMEEQIDFHGDKGIEMDMMDEKTMMAEDNGGVKDREEFGEEDSERSHAGGDDSKEKDDTTLEESAHQRSGVAERQRWEEPKEQIVFDVDNDIEEEPERSSI